MQLPISTEGNKGNEGTAGAGEVSPRLNDAGRRISSAQRKQGPFDAEPWMQIYLQGRCSRQLLCCLKGRNMPAQGNALGKCRYD